jgi:selenide,water dikinase
MGAAALMQVLHQLPKNGHKDLIAGIDPPDDAAVFRASKRLAVVSTLDFFPPIVDDPYAFGSIAAANALSDIYAMGGTPRFALNIVCFPKGLSIGILHEILKGSSDKLREAKTLLAGGHSIVGDEIKYGLSVTGFVMPDKVIKTTGARPGDSLILTKPIGVGIITTALKNSVIKEREARQAIRGMQALNKQASEAMLRFGATACTDITGFGLLGHSFEMADGSKVSLVISSKDVPAYPVAERLIERGVAIPGAVKSNRLYCRGRVRFSAPQKTKETLFYDPETSGGLLIAVPGKKKHGLVNALRKKGVRADVIGSVHKREKAWSILVE